MNAHVIVLQRPASVNLDYNLVVGQFEFSAS